jgi:hypothetical protein
MTGMVKEEVLARQAELGFSVTDGCIVFDFLLFERGELLQSPANYDYFDVSGQARRIELAAGSLAYTICQVPVVVRAGGNAEIAVHLRGGEIRRIAGHALDAATSAHIFQRDGAVERLDVTLA